MKGLTLVAMLASSAFLIGCEKDPDAFKRKMALPPFYSQLSPMQKEFYDNLNGTAKERIAAAPSAIEQRERFNNRWRRFGAKKKR